MCRVGGKNTLYHCVWCFASVSAFSRGILGKMDLTASSSGKRASEWGSKAGREVGGEPERE